MNLRFKSIRPILIILGIVSCILLGTGNIQAQTVQITPEIQAQINAELQKRGLTESEVRVRLLKKGINLDNVPVSELPNFKTRVIAVLNELQAEKAANKNTESSDTNQNPPANQNPSVPVAQPININMTQPTVSTDGSSAPVTISPPTIGQPQTTNTQVLLEPSAPVTTKQEAVAEAAQRVIQSAAKKNRSGIYGHSLFVDQSLDVFRTTDGSQAPETYILGEGDEIRISIFGDSQTDIQQKITSDGSIQPTGVARIYLKGLSLAQAREAIAERLSAAYTFRKDQFAVTIITARTIMVNVFGEAKVTGGFNLSALNSALNALSVAGGPTEIGSVRDIQLIRGNNRKSIDLYAFMNNPAAQFKFDLQANDIIFVPIIKLLVSIEGAVNRPMDYEMLPNESLTDLITFAGGLKMNVFPDFVQIKRYANGEERLLEYNLEDVRSGKLKVVLMNGDEVRIKSIGKPMDQYVDIEGSVYYPGRFDLSANATLGKLIDNAKPNYQAKTDVLFIERIRPDETVEQLTVPFPGTEPNAANFPLQIKDRVRVMDLASYRDVANISVEGNVRNPFTKTFALTDKVSIKKAIEMAGGLKISAYPIGYIARRNVFNLVEIKYIRIDLKKDENTELQPGDQLIVYDNFTYSYVGEISVNGSVKKPFSRTFASTDRLNAKQAIEIAGGLENSAYPVAYIFRRNLLNPLEVKYIRVEIDKAENYELQAGDQLNIYDNTTFTNIGEVKIFGAIKNPRGLTFDPSLTIPDLITTAGGFTLGAAFNRVEVFRTILSPSEKPKLELITLQVDSNYQVISHRNFTLQPYDQVVVRLTPEFSLGRTMQITGQVKYPGVYLLESKQTKLSDVIKMAGGLLPDADPLGSRLFRTYHSRGNISIDLEKALKHKHNTHKNPILFEGDIININRLENTVTIRDVGTRMTQYSTEQENTTLKNVVYQGNKSAAWYIKNFAGGFAERADKKSVTVILPNNQMLGTTRSFLFFRNYPEVKSGSMITLMMKPPEIVPIDGKKTDWDNIIGRTSTSLTTTITMYLLFKQLAK